VAVVGVKRGDIWLVDLNPVRGSEQRGVRPRLIVSNDITNEHAPTICVVPLTTNLAGRKFPINVLLTREDTGLKRDSLMLGGQIRTVAKERLVRRLSALQNERMPEVETALSLYLGLME
jgi:mRNA interferase MazF